MVNSVAVFFSSFTPRMNYPLFHRMDFIKWIDQKSSHKALPLSFKESVAA